MYGAKVLACRRCVLDLHGIPTDVTWTRLEETVRANSTMLKLQQAVDWNIGSYIIITSTDLVKEHVEEVILVGLDSSRKVISIDRPLQWDHLGETRYYGNNKAIEMRAEVGLLSRNVVVQGDVNSFQHEFGATIMMFSPGDESLIGRLENIEVRNAGQAGRLGRYPIHFHMIGAVKKSYARRNSVHRTFNRAFTIHGVHYLRIQYNVAFNVKGHTYFIEDAIETKNIIEYNLGALTRRGFNLLNTDQTPATFWITNPDVRKYLPAQGWPTYLPAHDLPA